MSTKTTVALILVAVAALVILGCAIFYNWWLNRKIRQNIIAEIRLRRRVVKL